MNASGRLLRQLRRATLDADPPPVNRPAVKASVEPRAARAISAMGRAAKLQETDMLRGFILGVIVTVIVAVGGVWLALKSGAVAANADVTPGGLELWAAHTSLGATLKREAPTGPNPVAATDASLSEGVKLYAAHCAICHGGSAGEASASPIAKGLYPRPPQLATDGVEDDPEGMSFWKIKHGIRLTGMPSWSNALNDQQIWTLALFLKHMDKLPPGPQAAWTQVRNTPTQP
jgi:mono/diheme cytochrome c family protein